MAKKSPGLKKQLELQQIEVMKKVQDPDVLNFITGRLDMARNVRMQQRREFDDMTYEQDYTNNQLAAHSYLRRKKNDDEVRVNTGTTEKKIELMLNELSAMNFQPEVRAFDDDDLEVVGVGEDFADIIKRTDEIERDQDVWEDAYLELLTQRALFMEEVYETLPRAMLRTGKKGRFTERKYAQKRLLSGLNVFLGDATIPAYRFQEQPFVVKYDRMLYDEAERLYGDLDKFQFVRPGMPMSNSYGLVFKYRFGNLKNLEVEVITYMSAADNEYQVIINGVMMYEPGQELPWNHGGYNMSMIVVKPMSRFFAYGKQPLASAKFLQGLGDETFRNLIRKMRQAIEPPIGVKSGRVFSKDIWSPAAVTQGIAKADFDRLIDHDGVTQSEMNMLDTIFQKVDEFIGPYGAANNPGEGGSVTATQIIEQQKQSMKMLGRAMVAVMVAKREMAYLRLWNIFDNYFKKEGGKHRKFTIDMARLEGDKFGKKIVAFADEELSEDDLTQVAEMEDEMDAMGKPMRYKQINVKMLQDYPLSWYVVVSSQQRESGSLDKVMFQDQLAQAAQVSQLTGRPLNPDKVIDGFERTWKAKLFEKQAPQNGNPAVQGQAEDMLKQLGGMEEGMGQPSQPPGQPGMPPGQPQGSPIAAQLTPQRPGAKQLVTQ